MLLGYASMPPVYIATLMLSASLVSLMHEWCRVANHMNHATRAHSMARAVLQWMSLSKILNYQSWRLGSGWYFQVSDL